MKLYLCVFRDFWKLIFKGEQEKDSIIRSHSCEGRIKKYVSRHRRLSSLASLVMPNGDPRDIFFYPTLTLMIDSNILAHRIRISEVLPLDRKS